MALSVRPFRPALAGALAVFAACAGGNADAPIRGTEVVLPLLERDDLRTIVVQNPARPVRDGVFFPSEAAVGEDGGLPALECTPPCEVRYELPPQAAGAELHLAIALGKHAQRRAGARVRFTGELDGRAFLDRTIAADTGERRWQPVSVNAEGGGTLVLRTVCTDPGEDPVPAAFARLEVRRHREIPRQRSSVDEPNAILVVIDTLRADRLGTYGGVTPTSPRMDRLAMRGTVFDRAYVPTPWTAPSTASILTALTPPQHGLGFSDSYVLPHRLRTVAEVLQDEGFTTAAFSTNPLIGSSHNFDQGFETTADHDWTRAAGIFDEVLAWVDAQKKNRFFLYLHLTEPHSPYSPEARFRTELAADVPLDHDGNIIPVVESFWKGGVGREDLERTNAHNLALYDGEIASVDQQLGRLLDRLEELGLTDRTVVAVTSDHGEEFLDHGLVGHVNQLHEELVRVPLILAGPGIPAGERRTTRVEVRFVAGTLLQLLGIHRRRFGPSLLDVEAVAQRAEEPLFLTTRYGRVRMGDGGWSPPRPLRGALLTPWLLLWAPEAGDQPEEVRLFDLSLDPDATTDVSAARPVMVQELVEGIRAWQREGRRSRPRSRTTGDGDLELLRKLGYVGDR